MPSPGDVVTVDFPGAMGIKRRPAVVVSSDLYHRERPDVVLAVLTSVVGAVVTSTDYVLQDWSAAGLKTQSAFLAYFATAHQNQVRPIGRLSARDWTEVRDRHSKAIG